MLTCKQGRVLGCCGCICIFLRCLWQNDEKCAKSHLVEIGFSIAEYHVKEDYINQRDRIDHKAIALAKEAYHYCIRTRIVEMMC